MGQTRTIPRPRVRQRRGSCGRRNWLCGLCAERERTPGAYIEVSGRGQSGIPISRLGEPALEIRFRSPGPG